MENYKSGFNSTAVQKLIDEDAVVLGMVNMDEFACGSSGESSAFGACKNPAALDRIPGGSSSGSAASVSADFCDFALGSDTGGSIRNPASHCRVVGLKPSYGAVSRYGLIDLSMSLDQIGVLAKSSEDCSLIFDEIKGKDSRDAVSKDFSSEKKDLKKIKIGILKIKADEKIWNLLKEISDSTDSSPWSWTPSSPEMETAFKLILAGEERLNVGKDGQVWVEVTKGRRPLIKQFEIWRQKQNPPHFLL